MRYAHARAVLLGAAAVMCSCVSPQVPQAPRVPTVTSTTLKRSSDPPRRLFVLSQHNQFLPDEYEDGYISTFAHGLEALGVKVMTMKLTGLELDRSAPDTARDEFAPDMTVTVVFNQQHSAHSTHRGVILVELLDSRGSALWTSRQPFAIRFSSVVGQGVIDAGKRAGSAAFRKLMEDRVFPGTI